MNGASSSRGAGSRTKPLKRGKACMNCRCVASPFPLNERLTDHAQVPEDCAYTHTFPVPPFSPCPQKCDGARPVCGPCLKHPKDDECEYDGPGRSRTKALEEQVHRLESRIQELENPGETTPSVTLHEPYSPTHQLSLSPHSSPTSHAGISLSASISPYETTPASTDSPSLLDRPHALPIKSSSSGGSRASPSVADRKPFSPFEVRAPDSPLNFPC